VIRPFRLHRPATLAEAAQLLTELPAAAAYRGGTELLQVMKLGLARFEHLVDLKRIEALHGVEITTGGALSVGAGTPHVDVERSAIVREGWPILAALERRVANPRVRSVGSIGGNLCFAEPHSDPATLLLALDARLETWSVDGARSLAVDELVLDAFLTDLQPGELLERIVIPPGGPGSGAGYARMALAERPIVSVACRISVSGGIVREARVVLGAVLDRPTRAPVAEGALVGLEVDAAAAGTDAAAAQVAALSPERDQPGLSADFQRHLVRTMASRAIGEAVANAHG
jgi:carbon-monoxide dehydrogenase medium subunit